MEPVLIGDIGATNARFALLQRNEPSEVRVLDVAAYKSLADAIQAYFDGLKARGSRCRNAERWQSPARLPATSSPLPTIPGRFRSKS